MKIGIDARFYGISGKGIGRYTKNLINNLEKIDFKNQYFIFLRKENFDEYVPKNHNFQKILADYRWYSMKEQIFFPFKLKKYNLDLVHFLHFNIPLCYFGDFIVTIHDLIHQTKTNKASKLPFLLFYIKKITASFIMTKAINRSIKVITISNFIKNQIIKKYKINLKKIIVIYESG